MNSPPSTAKGEMRICLTVEFVGYSGGIALLDNKGEEVVNENLPKLDHETEL